MKFRSSPRPRHRRRDRRRRSLTASSGPGAVPGRQEGARRDFFSDAARAVPPPRPRPPTARIFQTSDGYAALYEGHARAPRRRSADHRAGRAHQRVQIGGLASSTAAAALSPDPADHRRARRCSSKSDASVSGKRNFKRHRHRRPVQRAVGRDQRHRRRGLSQRHHAGAGPEARDAQPRRRVRPDQGPGPRRRYRREQPRRRRPASPMPASPIPARAMSPAPAARAG